MSRERAAAGLLFAALLTLLFSGMSSVPFHPDESSLLYQSRDLEQYLRDPRSMAWSASNRMDTDQTYRALNAPLAKYVLGIGRAVAGQGSAAVTVDWDWSDTWGQNQSAGALPPPEVLLPARLASTVLVAGSLFLILLTGRHLGGSATGLVSAALLGVNALVLLHGRRAMAEGTLIFAIALALWGIVLGDRKPWLAGIATALAFSAKHSALVLIPVGLLAVLWIAEPAGQVQGRGRLAAALSLFVVAVTVVVMLMNPILWANPLQSGTEILRARPELVREQLQAQSQYSRIRLPLSGVDRLSALIGQVFLTPPQFEEIPNYAQELAPSIQAYRDNPLHGLLRGWFAGGLLMGLTLAGWLFGLARLRLADAPERRIIGLLALSTLAQTVLLLLTLPFPYQRYYLPLVPLYTLWASYAMVRIAALIKGLPVRGAA